MHRQLGGLLRGQQHNPKILEMLKQGGALGRSKRPLAAPSEMLLQTASYVPVDLPVSRNRVSNRKVVRPPLQLPVQFADQNRNRLKTLMTTCHLMQLLPLLLLMKPIKHALIATRIPSLINRGLAL